MMTHLFRFVAVLAVLAGAWPAAAADVSASVLSAARCAPAAAAAPGAAGPLRILGAQDTVERSLFGPRDLVIVGGGTLQGLALGQQYFIRRGATFGHGRGPGPHAIVTAGALRIVAANETTAIATIDFACDGILIGDYLEPYALPLLPAGVDRTEAGGEPDFSVAGRVMFGQEDHQTGATADFMIVDVGQQLGIAPGTRFAIYRDVGLEGVPLAAIGEAVAVSVSPGATLVRITRSRDAIVAGDLVIPRRVP